MHAKNSPLRWTLALSATLVACGGGGGSSSTPGGSTGSGNLSPVSITAAPASVTAGDSLVVAESVRWIGTGTSGSFRVAVYASTDLAFDSGDTLVGARTVPDLAVGSDSSSAQTYTVPASLTSGTYFLALVVDDQNAVGENNENDNVLWATQPLTVQGANLPDLTWQSVSFSPTAASPGDSLTLSDTVRNVGSQAASAARLGVYLSLDGQIDASDTLVSFRSLSGLGVNQTDTGSGTVTLPTNLADGTYQVLWMADDLGQVAETNENNNVQPGLGTLVIGSGGGSSLCELVPQDITFSPAVQDVGQLIQVDESVLNVGPNPAPTFQMAVYLSTDAVWDTSDRLLGFRTIPTLGVNQTSASVNQSFQLPGDLSAGIYRLILVADDSGLANETNENNNVLVANVSLGVTVPPLPDLVGDSISYSPSSVGQGGALNINETVRNSGTAGAGPFRVAVYLSPNPSVTPSDVLLGSRIVNSLGQGQTSGANTPYTVPSNLAAGTYFVGLFVDDLSQVAELHEGNNVQMAAGTLNYSTSGNPTPNLVMESMTVSDTTVTVGDSVAITTTVHNDGDEDAPPFLVGIYLSTDATITAQDLPLVVRSVSTGLDAGFTSVQAAPVLVPNNIPAGTYFMGAIADKDGTINELDETDNLFELTGMFTVEAQLPPAPDLVALTPTGPSGTQATGTAFTVEPHVRNSGEQPAGAFRVGVYLSSDDTIDASDLLLGTINMAGLTVGASSQVSTSVQIPVGTAPGSYRIGTWADDLSSVQESGREANNTALVAGSITVP